MSREEFSRCEIDGDSIRRQAIVLADLTRDEGAVLPDYHLIPSYISTGISNF